MPFLSSSSFITNVAEHLKTTADEEAGGDNFSKYDCPLTICLIIDSMAVYWLLIKVKKMYVECSCQDHSKLIC